MTGNRNGPLAPATLPGLIRGDPSAAETVRALLAAAGLGPDADELAELIHVYPSFRAALDRLYDLPEARYAPPALVFGAASSYRDWRDQDAGASVSTDSGGEGGA